jgi:hypothetical protein
MHCHELLVSHRHQQAVAAPWYHLLIWILQNFKMSFSCPTLIYFNTQVSDILSMAVVSSLSLFSFETYTVLMRFPRNCKNWFNPRPWFSRTRITLTLIRHHGSDFLKVTPFRIILYQQMHLKKHRPSSPHLSIMHSTRRAHSLFHPHSLPSRRFIWFLFNLYCIAFINGALKLMERYNIVYLTPLYCVGMWVCFLGLWWQFWFESGHERSFN